MKFLKHIVLVIVLVAIVSCNKSSPDCFKRAGVRTSVVRTLAPFKNVFVDANVEVVLRNGSDYKAEVIGNKNLLDKVTTSVTDGTLTIDNRNGCNFVRGYKHRLMVIVTAPDFENAISNSIGGIRTEEGFVEDSLSFYTEGGDITINGNFYLLNTGSHGNGNVYFNGTVSKMFVYMNGTNFLYADTATILNYLFIEHISLGDAHVKAPTGGQMDYHTRKRGNIYYTGDPAVIKGSNEGTGTIIKK